MIPNLSEEDKNNWNRKMEFYNRRQKRSNTWSTIRHIGVLLTTIVFVTAVVRACNEVTWKPKPSDFVADSLYVDSVINGHGPLKDDNTGGSPAVFIRAIDDSVGRIDTFPLKWGRAGSWSGIRLPGSIADTFIAVDFYTDHRDTAILFNRQNPFN